MQPFPRGVTLEHEPLRVRLRAPPTARQARDGIVNAELANNARTHLVDAKGAAKISWRLARHFNRIPMVR